MKAKRISKGHYEYRGFEIICIGYYPPEKRVVWECVDENGNEPPVDGYLDHGSEAKEFVDYVLSSPENTVKFIFDYRCYIETGNDNEGSCVDNESCNYGEAIMFEKGN